jgi:two-component system chemotaxis response regulator CheY
MQYDLLKVLIVDDNRFTRILLTEILRAVGVIHIYEAADGAEGLKRIADRPVDLVITDLSMEPMDGIDFIRLLRTSPDSPNQFAPVIMVTGHSTLTRVREARDAGVSEFLAKPFNARAVIQKLHWAIERPRPFVRRDDFTGPDRRRRVDPGFRGPGRRPGDGGGS